MFPLGRRLVRVERFYVKTSRNVSTYSPPSPPHHGYTRRRCTRHPGWRPRARVFVDPGAIRLTVRLDQYLVDLFVPELQGYVTRRVTLRTAVGETKVPSVAADSETKRKNGSGVSPEWGGTTRRHGPRSTG